VGSQRQRHITPVGASPNTHEVARWVKNLDAIEAREINDESTVIGRKSAQAMSTAAHGERYLVFAGETDCGADVISGLGTNNCRWTSRPVEDIAHSII
jgi:hypothetical protein